MTRRAVLFSCLPPLLAAGTDGASEAQALLTKVAEGYQAFRSYRFHGKSLSESKIKGKVTSSELEFDAAFQAPDKFLLEFRYPHAGNWLRASDGKFLYESRSSIKGSAQRTPVTDHTIRILNSSPTRNFARLVETAQDPILLRSEMRDVAGKGIDCHVIQFSSHRQSLQPGDVAGPSLVWIAKDNLIVLREEIRTLVRAHDEQEENNRITWIEGFEINQDLDPALFATASR